MNIEVRYLSRSGNTKRVAEAIANAVNVRATSVTEPVGGDTDLLFLGGAVYGFGIDDSLKKFISELPQSVKHVVIFSTSAVVKSAFSQMSALLAERDFDVCPFSFHCWGAFTFMHRGRPNAEDLQNAEVFARKAAEAYKTAE
jgi:flavodoxin